MCIRKIQIVLGMGVKPPACHAFQGGWIRQTKGHLATKRLAENDDWLRRKLKDRFRRSIEECPRWPYAFGLIDASVWVLVIESEELWNSFLQGFIVSRMRTIYCTVRNFTLILVLMFPLVSPLFHHILILPGCPLYLCLFSHVSLAVL